VRGVWRGVARVVDAVLRDNRKVRLEGHVARER
jgi:hypothetical protein